MAIEVETKDCTALSDAELEEMANMTSEGPVQYDIGVVSKQRDSWVLVTVARDGSKLRGFSFCTLERIGGTPCVLIGLASIARTARRESVLKAIMTDQYRRAALAFPDEDVLVGTRFGNIGCYEAYRSLHDIVPRPDHKASGEERAWGRRLVKRFAIDASSYDDRAFAVAGDGSTPIVLDHESAKPEKLDQAFAQFFDPVKAKRGDALIAFGWAKAEDLDKLMPAG